MTKDEKKKLTHHLERIQALTEEKKALEGDIKEHIEAASEETGLTKVVVKQLAKEWAMSRLEREAQRLHEEEMDKLRVAIGMLADTPLGMAAMEDRDSALN